MAHKKSDPSTIALIDQVLVPFHIVKVQGRLDFSHDPMGLIHLHFKFAEESIVKPTSLSQSEYIGKERVHSRVVDGRYERA